MLPQFNGQRMALLNPSSMRRYVSRWCPGSQENAALSGGYLGAPSPREGGDLLKEVILLAACSAGEVLPQTPDLPADVFTACLTTPIKVCLLVCSAAYHTHQGALRSHACAHPPCSQPSVSCTCISRGC